MKKRFDAADIFLAIMLFTLAIVILFAVALDVAYAADAAPPPPDKKINITLTVEQWNVVLQALGSQAYDRVQPLIGEMQAQAAQQLTSTPIAPDKKEKK